MRNVPDAMTAAWKEEAKIGDERRPVVRATIQRIKNIRFQYDKGLAPGEDFGHQFGGKGNFTSVLFAQQRRVVELPNILNWSWNRSTEQDVAEGTITMLNTAEVAMGSAPQDDPEEFDRPGWLTFNRGNTNPWGYQRNGWRDMLVPDRVIKTYEGYGLDVTVDPADDIHLVQTGVWLIDDVTYQSDGTITVKVRDLGRLLIDQIVMPPVLPFTEYPMEWSKIKSGPIDGLEPTGGSWGHPRGAATSSNGKYVDAGLTNAPHKNYVNQWGNVDGHRDGDPLTGKGEADVAARPLADQYWSSTGQPGSRATVWWQVDLTNPTGVNAVRLRPKGGPYRVYVSLKGADGWIGRKTIPYDKDEGAGGINVHADIPFVDSFLVQPGKTIDHVLRRRYKGVQSVRITLTRLRDTGVGEYPYRAGLFDVQIYSGDAGALGTKKGSTTGVVGNYSDFTDIVKWCCAWAGFFWPPHATGQDFVRHADGTKEQFTYDSPDPKLPRGRVWGDFMNSGTAGIADLTADLFDKQPLMDVISYIRDQLGFLFFVDETGAAVWRLPNIWGPGNYLSPGQHATPDARGRTQDYVELTDDEDIISYSTTLSSRDLRERIFVANSDGKVGSVVKAFKPYATGFRRTAGWTDEHFDTKNETLVMGDMIAAQQMFGYRVGSVQIDGYPAIQIDDQIRIHERVTGETYWHYVKGITSTLDMQHGTWTYDLETHWLGENRSDAWVVDPTQLDPATQNYLELVQKGYGLNGGN